jgi:hypothetical protein
MKVSQCPSRSLTTRVSQVPDSVVADVPAATPLLKVYDSGPSGPAFYLSGDINIANHCALARISPRDFADTQFPALLPRAIGQLV